MTKRMLDTETDELNIHWELLVALTDKLKIPDEKYNEAVEAYKDIAKLFHASGIDIFDDSIIYPQGSVRLGTTIKPYGSDEYDIDLVIHLPNVLSSHSSENIHRIIGDVLDNSPIYEDFVEPLKRGWRINYPGNFHLDITPAIPNNECNNKCPINKQYAEFVPDKKLKNWKDSNPRGLAYEFCKIDEQMPKFTMDTKAFNIAFESRVIEEIPDQHEFKGLLKRAVQLLKRHRDVYFNEREPGLKDFAPISILITILAAYSYDKLIKENKTHHPVILLKSLIKDMKNHILLKDGEFYVPNPTNLDENFAEKWNEDSRYEIAFNKWISDVFDDIELILHAEGLDRIGFNINSIFGEEYGSSVIKNFTDKVNKGREVGVASGIFTLNSDVEPTVPKNTFYGA